MQEETKKPIDWINNNKSLFVIILLLIAFCFYWFQLRPSVIKHNCSIDKRVISEWNITRQNAYFEQCLKENGL
jgi:plastocyanin domain-containing protein